MVPYEQSEVSIQDKGMTHMLRQILYKGCNHKNQTYFELQRRIANNSEAENQRMFVTLLQMVKPERI